MSATDTKQTILDAAEDLFAEQGYAATSLRQLTGKARVNLAAVHYHFGSKEDLAKAVLARRIEPINVERIARLDALPARRRTVRTAIRIEPVDERVGDRCSRFVVAGELPQDIALLEPVLEEL